MRFTWLGRLVSGVLLLGSVLTSGCGSMGGPGPGPMKSCVASTCNGCCDNGICQAGNADALCGQNANACFACPTHQSCQSGQCGLAQRWVLRVVGATVTGNCSGSPCDTDGPPDPVIIVENQPSPPQPNTLTPVWGFELNVSVDTLLTQGVGMQVYDDDGFGVLEKMTQPRTELFTTEDLIAGGKTITNWDAVQRIDFTVVKQ